MLITNSAYVSNPGSYVDVVELLVPELQKRGLMWNDYAVPQGTFRENLLGHKYLADDHYGAKFKYGRDPSLVSNLENGSSKVNGEGKPVNGVPKMNGETEKSRLTPTVAVVEVK